jgi:transposase-like protein
VEAQVISPSETEVSSKANRRRFTAKYKAQILAEADACTKKGELGALLRREGLYSSHIASWRAARAQRGDEGLAPQKRGPKARSATEVANAKRIVELEREVRDARRWKARAERAEGLVELQKKVSQILGIELPEDDKQ